MLDVSSEVFESVRAQVESVLRWTAVPLGFEGHTRRMTVASGVLVRLLDNHFVITSSHVFDEFFEGKDEVFLPLTPEEAGIPLGTELVRFGGSKEDVALLRLTESHVRALEAMGSRFVRLSDSDCSSGQLQDAGYVVIGYPQDHLQVDAAGDWRVRSADFHCVRFEGSDDELASSYDPSLHALLRWNAPVGSNGETVPHPGGMSGAGVWRTFTKREVKEGRWSVDSARLVGIQSGYFPDPGALKIVRFQLVRELIARAYPETGRATQLVRT